MGFQVRRGVGAIKLLGKDAKNKIREGVVPRKRSTEAVVDRLEA